MLRRVMVKHHVNQLLRQQVRRESSLLVAGGLGVAALAFGSQQLLIAYKKWQSNSQTSSGESSSGDPIFTNFFARRFYDGPFEAKMTRREAALILGVRESANSERIKEAHRRILRINHPDMGGSTYVLSSSFFLILSPQFSCWQSE
uniref:J domain-containing protein n=1 Tax=Aureoumbra lagunensis TaxID=44058 RepID=A0A7S3K3A3_9STRA|mmetsp:Transcript_5190/g.7704  ORF Transcript_5190/g.7704 Transcript_5190/m.7704 type:complete len:146 (-) Transcript_5190:249-686(-)